MRESDRREANFRLVLAVVVLVLLIVVFSSVVYLGYNAKPNEKFWDWLIALLGTLISFPLGLAAGFAHLNRQNTETQRKREEKLRSLLLVELQETLDICNNNKNPIENILMFIQLLILEEAVKSGLFEPNLTKDMLKLTKTYHKYNDHVTTVRAASEPKA